MDKKNLLTIGQLSKISNTHIKAIRYYEKIGIFPPSYIDPDNSYRYYSNSHVIYLQLIKLCVTYDISLKSFNSYWEDEDKLNLNALISQAKRQLSAKKKQLLIDEQFLTELDDELDFSQQLHQHNDSDTLIESKHEDFLLIPFEGDIFSYRYYEAFHKALAIINQHQTTYFNKVGCFYDIKPGNIKQFLALKIKAHTKTTSCLTILHIDKKAETIKHILPEEMSMALAALAQTDCKCLILETYESPYHVLNPHLELRRFVD